MAQKKYWIGTTGPFLYDDTQVYSDGPVIKALRTEGDLQVDGLIIGDAAPKGADYVTLSANATLTAERTLAVGNSITKVDSGANNPVTLDTIQDIRDTAGPKFASLNLGVASPTAVLHIKAGTTAAGTAPLKLTTQAAGLTTVEQGAFELIGNSLQFTQLAKRCGVAMGQNVRVASTTVGNTTTESAALITAEHGANYLEVGKMEELVLLGTIEQRSNPNAFITIRIKYAGSTVHSFTTPVSTTIAAGTVYRLVVVTTCRTIGASGTLQIDSSFTVRGALDTGTNSLVSIDTTTAQDITVTVQWGEANANDIFVVEQGRILCIDTDK